MFIFYPILFIARYLIFTYNFYNITVYEYWVIHLANSNARRNFGDRSTLLHRYLHIDSNVLKAVHHNNVSNYVYLETLFIVYLIGS